MKYLSLLLKAIEMYFVFKNLNKNGFIKTYYPFKRILKVVLNNPEELDFILRHKEVMEDEKKQSESEAI